MPDETDGGAGTMTRKQREEIISKIKSSFTDEEKAESCRKSIRRNMEYFRDHSYEGEFDG